VSWERKQWLHMLAARARDEIDFATRMTPKEREGTVLRLAAMVADLANMLADKEEES
jgi:hypothetical protein